jgi:hypothetical protein
VSSFLCFSLLKNELPNFQMGKTINIVVTCTSRKTRDPLARFRLRDVRDKTVQDRALNWIERLRTNADSRTGASQLYCGEYWSIVRSLPLVARDAGVTPRIWICSAGYGLISPQSQISSYSATFSPYERDSVTRGFDADARRIAARQWWRSISSWSGPSGTELRSLTAIARRYQNVPLLVVASPDYLQAIDQDLTGAAAALSRPDLLLIVSAGTRTFGKLTDHLLPCDARLQSCLGGTRGTLNIRIARRLLQYMGGSHISLDRQKVQLRRLLSKQPPIEQYHRRVVTDEQVRKFIRSELNKNKSPSRSLLLKKLRSSGRACEQSRFAELYTEMVSDEKVA